MLNPKFALVPGSFDPPTAGHYDLVVRAAAIFEQVWVTAFVNSEKQGKFTPEQKREMLEAAFVGIENVHVDVSDELLADYAAKRGIGTIVKGARSSTDFDYELSMYAINRSLNSGIDTLIIPTKAEYMHISSTMVRDMIRYSQDYSKLVAPNTAEIINKIVNKNQ